MKPEVNEIYINPSPKKLDLSSYLHEIQISQNVISGLLQRLRKLGSTRAIKNLGRHPKYPEYIRILVVSSLNSIDMDDWIAVLKLGKIFNHFIYIPSREEFSDATTGWAKDWQIKTDFFANRERKS